MTVWTMGKDIDLMQAVRDEDLSVLQKLLDRSRSQRSSKLACICLTSKRNVRNNLQINKNHIFGFLDNEEM